MNNQAPAGCGVFADVAKTVRFAMTADRNGTWRAVFDRQAIDGRAAGFHRNLKWEIELLVDGKSVHASLPSLAPPDLAERVKTFTAFVYCHR